MAGANGIAVLVPIKAGEEDACIAVLDGINSGDAGCVTIDFAQENRTHFARFVILPDPNRGIDRKRVLFSAIFDGTKEAFFRDMQKNTSEIGAIWSHCEGYTGNSNFVQFALQHNIQNGTYLRGHRYETVSDIQGYLQCRDDLRAKFNVPPSQFPQLLSTLPKRLASEAQRTEVWRDMGNFFRDVWTTLQQVPALIGLLRFGTHLLTVREKLGPHVVLDRDYSLATYDRSGPCHPLEDGDEVIGEKTEVDLDALLDRQMVQNQMTVITANNPKHLRQQYAILETLGVLAQIPFLNRNPLIPTIHFGRWMMIDDGKRMLFLSKRMLFLSNYDGSWENYIGDFVDKAADGLDAFWGGSLGWRIAATLDIELFKEGIRCHQTKANYFYCAYPKATVVNIRRAKAIALAYENNVDENSAKQWLKGI